MNEISYYFSQKIYFYSEHLILFSVFRLNEGDLLNLEGENVIVEPSNMMM